MTDTPEWQVPMEKIYIERKEYNLCKVINVIKQTNDHVKTLKETIDKMEKDCRDVLEISSYKIIDLIEHECLTKLLEKKKYAIELVIAHMDKPEPYQLPKITIPIPQIVIELREKTKRKSILLGKVSSMGISRLNNQLRYYTGKPRIISDNEHYEQMIEQPDETIEEIMIDYKRKTDSLLIEYLRLKKVHDAIQPYLVLEKLSDEKDD